ncbi:MAG TPA: condensation domain-containing protein, partial [Thermoanaerobaculia bacterium]|nr:condensation domain-containing protein [Thermoanaerobaculia bacterium]
MSERIEGAGTVQPPAFQGFPLSPQQRRIAALGDGEFGVRGAILIEGPLDSEELRAAVAAAVERHEILRTTYRRLPGMAEPLQVIGEADFAWEEAEGDGELLDDFRAGGSWLRLRLVRLSADRHVLLVALPALAADARTLENFVAEIAGAGAAEPMQYADYAAWYNEVLGSADPVVEEELPPLLRTIPGSGFAPAALRFAPDPESAAAAQAALGTSLEAALLAAFQAVLARFTGHSRLAVAVRLHGRDFEELEGALGAFARDVPVIADVDEDSSFGDLVRAAARSLLRARERQEGFAWEAFFPAWIFQLETPPRRYESNGVAFILVERRVVTERFELALSCTPGLELELLYDPAHWDEATVRRLAASFLELLRQSPGMALGDLDLPAEEPDHTAVDLPGAGLCLHQLVAVQAARTPGRVAVRDDQQSLTWEELVTAADRLALQLISAGVRPEDRVAIRRERSVDMVVG